ncbi:MAG: ParA family protein [Actinomycetota bacterium]|nr:ParA family protein [Actinomycetota bacterium]
MDVLVATVLSLKGGVGKTTVALGLASAAVHRGVRTVLVDLDPQANASATLAPDHDPSLRSEAGTVAEVLVDPRRSVVRAALRPTAWGDSLRLLVGSERTEAHNHPDPGSKRLTRLATAVGKLPADPELVLIDCPPSLGQLTRSALVASDRAVLVTEPSLYAVAGVQRALEAVQAERAHHHGLQPLGVVINRVRPGSPEHAFRLGELRELFGPLVLQPALPERGAIQRAQGAAEPIHGWQTAGAREIAAMFDALLDRLLRAGNRKSGARR